ncbi:MAG: aminotransferase class IV [Sciscionella sp.]|nr:aminotransferase class IV [Sciscionella sp.]
MSEVRIEINGGSATVDQLAYPAIVNYGHFTAMQVRGGAVRGLDLHLARLDAASRELFGTGLPGERVRRCVRQALRHGTADASVRVGVFQPDGDDAPSVMVVVRPPVEPPGAAQSLTAVPDRRSVAHLKHTGTFAQIYHGQAAERAGFDDALLTDQDGLITETTTGNVGFFDGTALIWPDAPALPGITMRLLTRTMTGRGLPVRHAPVHIADLPSLRSVFVTNSVGIVAVQRVDDQLLASDPGFVHTLVRTYESVPLDPI